MSFDFVVAYIDSKLRKFSLFEVFPAAAERIRVSYIISF